jgi:hypothetical protein
VARELSQEMSRVQQCHGIPNRPIRVHRRPLHNTGTSGQALPILRVGIKLY